MILEKTQNLQISENHFRKVGGFASFVFLFVIAVSVERALAQGFVKFVALSVWHTVRTDVSGQITVHRSGGGGVHAVALEKHGKLQAALFRIFRICRDKRGVFASRRLNAHIENLKIGMRCILDFFRKQNLRLGAFHLFSHGAPKFGIILGRFHGAKNFVNVCARACVILLDARDDLLARIAGLRLQINEAVFGDGGLDIKPAVLRTCLVARFAFSVLREKRVVNEGDGKIGIHVLCAEFENHHLARFVRKRVLFGRADEIFIFFLFLVRFSRKLQMLKRMHKISPCEGLFRLYSGGTPEALICIIL